MSADPQALQKDIAADRQEAISRQSALDTARQQSATQREGELAPMEAGVSKEIDQLGAVKPPPKADLPTYQPKPLVDPNEYQKFSGALLGMALIAGIASKGNWMGVTASLNGALKGHLEGDQARAEKDWQDYKTKFDEAKAKSEAQQKEFADILQNKRLTINDMLTQIKIASAKYGRDDTKFEAEQKSIDGIWKRIESMDTSLTRISDMDQRQRRQIDARFQMQKIAQSGGAEQLTGAGIRDSGHATRGSGVCERPEIPVRGKTDHSASEQDGRSGRGPRGSDRGAQVCGRLRVNFAAGDTAQGGRGASHEVRSNHGKPHRSTRGQGQWRRQHEPERDLQQGED